VPLKETSVVDFLLVGGGLASATAAAEWQMKNPYPRGPFPQASVVKSNQCQSIQPTFRGRLSKLMTTKIAAANKN